MDCYCLRFIFLDLEIDFLNFDVKFETKLSVKHLILNKSSKNSKMAFQSSTDYSLFTYVRVF